jgi:hypothetical protein
MIEAYRNSGVYFVLLEPGGFVKIGCSGRLENRIASLHRPNRRLLGIISTPTRLAAHWLERELHWKFMEHRARRRGEVFRDVPELRDWIRQNRTDRPGSGRTVPTRRFYDRLQRRQRAVMVAMRATLTGSAPAQKVIA